MSNGKPKPPLEEIISIDPESIKPECLTVFSAIAANLKTQSRQLREINTKLDSAALVAKDQTSRLSLILKYMDSATRVFNSILDFIFRVINP